MNMDEELFAEKECAQVTPNSIGDAIVCADLRGSISFLNPVAETMTWWLHQEAIDLWPTTLGQSHEGLCVRRTQRSRDATKSI